MRINVVRKTLAIFEELTLIGNDSLLDSKIEKLTIIGLLLALLFFLVQLEHIDLRRFLHRAHHFLSTFARFCGSVVLRVTVEFEYREF